ncbi:MAG: phosphotransferase [Pseudomonadales bacterium]|nr:phosphotransferase [Pseudomonadales bacterium]
MPVVAHPSQVTPEWLTNVLRDCGFTGSVSDIAWQDIGAGQVGDNARFDLQVDGDLPTSVVGKFPSSDPVSKQTGIDGRNYAREVFFYTELAHSVDIQTPQVFTTEFDPSNHDFVVLMEDLAPGTQIDQMSECTVDEAALALEQLAKLHGPRWADTTLDQHHLLQRDPTATTDIGDLYQMVQPGFLERYQERLNEFDVIVVDRFGHLQNAYHDHTSDQTLIHIDYRLDNMIFGGPYPLTVIDWQSINIGCAFNDVSYFMGTSLSPERRAASERDLLKHYLEILASYQVILDWDSSWRLYRHYAPAGLTMAVIASMIVGETDRGNEMFMTMAKRSIAMSEDLDALELLGAT